MDLQKKNFKGILLPARKQQQIAEIDFRKYNNSAKANHKQATKVPLSIFQAG